MITRRTIVIEKKDANSIENGDLEPADKNQQKMRTFTSSGNSGNGNNEKSNESD